MARSRLCVGMFASTFKSGPLEPLLFLAARKAL